MSDLKTGHDARVMVRASEKAPILCNQHDTLDPNLEMVAGAAKSQGRCRPCRPTKLNARLHRNPVSPDEEPP